MTSKRVKLVSTVLISAKENLTPFRQIGAHNPFVDVEAEVDEFEEEEEFDDHDNELGKYCMNGSNWS